MSQKYILKVNYPVTSEEIELLKKQLGIEYLKLVKAYLEKLDIGKDQKKEIALMIGTGIKIN